MIYLVHQLTSSLPSTSPTRILIWSLKLDSYSTALPSNRMKKKMREKCFYKVFLFAFVVVKWLFLSGKIFILL